MIPMRQQPVNSGADLAGVGDCIAHAETALLHYRDPEPDHRKAAYRDVRSE
jgi:hypothetical protein